MDVQINRAMRESHPEDTTVNVSGVCVGKQALTVIAGPCAVENEKQIVETAMAVKKAGAKMLRGGAFKPRTSPYSFQGLGEEGLRLLSLAKKETGLPIVSEVLDPSQLSLFDDVDMIQVGARNMQNFQLLKELGMMRKPILLKRGAGSTLSEFIMSAEYIMAGGNNDVILCERGIRTFEPSTRYTLDLSAVPVLKEMTHLPIIVDPSHACGDAKYVQSMSYAAIAAGAYGLIVEVHINPGESVSDAKQAISPEHFGKIMEGANAIWKSVN